MAATLTEISETMATFERHFPDGRAGSVAAIFGAFCAGRAGSDHAQGIAAALTPARIKLIFREALADREASRLDVASTAAATLLVIEEAVIEQAAEQS